MAVAVEVAVAVDAVKSGGKTTDETKGVVGGDSKSVEEIADRIARLEREVVVLKVSLLRSEVMFRVESTGVESGWKVMRERERHMVTERDL